MRTFLTTIALLGSFLLQAQNEQYLFSRLSEKDGLTGNQVTCFLKDKDGFLWVGTNEGLNLYDGYEFRVFQHNPQDSNSLIYNHISALHQDKEGLLWIGTEGGGVSVLDLLTETFRNYPYTGDLQKSVAGDRIRCFAEDKEGNIWIGLDNRAGLNRFNKSSGLFDHWPMLHPMQSSENRRVLAIRDMLLDGTDSTILWLASTAGLASFNTKGDGEFRFRKHPAIRKGADPQFAVWTLDQQSDNEIRAGFFNLGTDVYNTRTQKWDGVYHKPSSHLRIFDLARKSTDEYWVAAREKSVGILNITTNTFTFLPTDLNNETTPYPGYTSTTMIEDGKLWAGGRHGISLYDPSANQFALQRLPFTNSLGRTVCATEKYDKRYVGGFNTLGIYEIDPGTSTVNFYRPYERTPFDMTDFEETQEKIYLVNFPFAIYEFNKRTKGFKKLELKNLTDREVIDMRPREIELISDSILLIGTDKGGVLRYNLQNQQMQTFLDQKKRPLTAYYNNDFEKMSDGSYWISSDSGVVIYREEDISINHLFLKSLGTRKNQRITSFKEYPEGTFWIGTHSGLVRMSGGSDELIKGRGSRLEGHAIQDLELDSSGNLWVGSDGGISILNTHTMEVRNYDSEDGLNFNGGIENIGNGHFYLNAEGGYVYFHPDSLLRNRKTPYTRITSFRLFNKQVHSGIIDARDTIHLSYKDNFFSLTFVSPTLTEARKVRYSYWLEGFDEDWLPEGSRRYASYTNLDGGTYHFHVKAKSADGVWGPVHTKTILITPPFWKTWWFISLSVLVTAGLVHWFYRFRIHQAVKEEKLRSEFAQQLAEVEMRALRSQMNPHFLFNSINSINSYIIKNSIEEATNYLSRFSRLIRLILQNSMAKVIPLNEEIEALTLYIEMEALRFERKFQHSVSIADDVELDHMEIPPLIIQPYVENAIWHGLLHKKKEARLTLDLRKKGNHLQVTVDDNGIGRAAAAELKSKSVIKKKSMGMKITEDRLNLVKKLYGEAPQVTITDKTDKEGNPTGTKVEILIPVYGYN